MMQTTTTEEMGKVTTTLTVTNRIDQVKAEEGLISAEEIRSVTLENVLVDTGVTTLCLPPDVIAKLGLKLLKEVKVNTDLGASTTRVFRDASISLLGREGTFECLEVTSSQYSLLGVVPLKMLGIEVDLNDGRLIVLPDASDDTYLTIKPLAKVRKKSFFMDFSFKILIYCLLPLAFWLLLEEIYSLIGQPERSLLNQPAVKNHL